MKLFKILRKLREAYDLKVELDLCSKQKAVLQTKEASPLLYANYSLKLFIFNEPHCFLSVAYLYNSVHKLSIISAWLIL